MQKRFIETQTYFNEIFEYGGFCKHDVKKCYYITAKYSLSYQKHPLIYDANFRPKIESTPPTTFPLTRAPLPP